MSSGDGRRTRVKICGLTRPADAELAVSLGADLLGLNFWPGSVRHLEPAVAREIADAVRGDVTLVGVFVNEEPERVEEIAAEIGLDLLQFHGDEGPEDLVAFSARAIKAVRFTGTPEPGALAGYPSAWGFLVEARAGGTYGGAGQGWDHGAARTLAGGELAGRPLLIAGGLRPENVGAAIEASGAWGVDVATGVESEPGVKDRVKLERFFAEVRRAAP